jgi:hypothetical protein
MAYHWFHGGAGCWWRAWSHMMCCDEFFEEKFDVFNTERKGYYGRERPPVVSSPGARLRDRGDTLTK